MDVSSFRNVYPSVRSLQILWRRTEGQILKKSLPTVLNNLSDSNNYRSRDTAVLGVVNATENKQKSPKGDSHLWIEEDLPSNFVTFCEELEVELSTKFHRFLRSLDLKQRSYSVTYVVRWKRCETFTWYISSFLRCNFFKFCRAVITVYAFHLPIHQEIL